MESGDWKFIELLIYPAHGDLHALFFSSNSTLNPADATVLAVTDPAGPAPMAIRS